MLSQRMRDARKARLAAYEKAMEMKEQGLNGVQITAKLRDLGLVSGSGKPFSEPDVSKIMTRRVFVGNMQPLVRGIKRRGPRQKPVAASKMPDINVPVTFKTKASRTNDLIDIITLVMASNLPPEAKMRVVKAMTNES